MTATNYVDVTAFKNYASIPASNTSDDTIIATVTQAVFAAINNYCGRQFSTQTGSRVYEVRNPLCLYIDDVSTATGVTVSSDLDGDGTYETTWASTDYELRPLNGLLNGTTWPYTEIRAVGNQTFPIQFVSVPAGVQVSATWGWPAVPNDVVQAAYLLTMDLWKSKDAPFGVAGTTEFGTVRVGSQVAGMAKMLLTPYHRTGVML